MLSTLLRSSSFFSLSNFDIPIDVDLTQMEFLSVDDPAFFCIYASNSEIHAALGIPGAPVAQGATPALSTAAFVMGLEKGMALIESTPGADAYMVRKVDGCCFASEGFPVTKV